MFKIMRGWKQDAGTFIKEKMPLKNHYNKNTGKILFWEYNLFPNL